jgi:hypothetical protein
MEPDGSSHWSQHTTSGPYSEAVQSIAYFHNLFV